MNREEEEPTAKKGKAKKAPVLEASAEEDEDSDDDAKARKKKVRHCFHLKKNNLGTVFNLILPGTSPPRESDVEQEGSCAGSLRGGGEFGG